MKNYRKKNIVRVSNALLELIHDPKKITDAHRFCLWCGMVKAYPKRKCEICGNHGNRSRLGSHERVYVELY